MSKETNIYMYTYVNTYLCIYTYWYKCKYVQIKNIYICICTDTYIHINVFSYTYVYTCIYIYIQIHIYIYSYVYRQSGHRGEAIDRVAEPEAHILGFKIFVQPPLGSLHPQKKREKEKKYQTQESHVNRYRDWHTWLQDIRVTPTWIHALPNKRTQEKRSTPRGIARCSVLQLIAVCCRVLQLMQCVAVCCHVLQCVAVSVAVCCSVMQCVAVRYLAAKSTLCNASKRQDICCTCLCCSVLQCIAVWCSAWQCVAVRCNLLPRGQVRIL